MRAQKQPHLKLIIYINNLSERIDSESGTTIHKALLKSEAFFFSGYGRFLVVTGRYLFAGFVVVLCF